MNNGIGFFGAIKSAFTSATKGLDSFCDWANDPATAERNIQVAATAITNLANKLSKKQVNEIEEHQELQETPEAESITVSGAESVPNESDDALDTCSGREKGICNTTCEARWCENHPNNATDSFADCTTEELVFTTAGEDVDILRANNYTDKEIVEYAALAMNESVLRYGLEEAASMERIKVEGTVFVAKALFNVRRRVRICKDAIKSFGLKQVLFTAALTVTVCAGLAYGWISRKVTSIKFRKETLSVANA